MKAVPYRSAIGSLLYVALCTRPDIAFVVCHLARFSKNPGHAHWEAVKNVIRYLLHTRQTGLMYHYPVQATQNTTFLPYAWSDSAFNNTEDGRSTLGFVIYVGDMPISWRSKASKTVAQSSFEAEWIAVNTVCRELIIRRA